MNKTNELIDPISERLILSAILEHGGIVFHDIDSALKEHDFGIPQNKLLFSVLKDIIVNDKVIKPDSTTILGKIQSLDKNLSKKYDLPDYIFALQQDNIQPDGVKIFVNKVARLGLARNLRSKLEHSIRELNKIEGDESLLNILRLVEKPINDFTVNLIHGEDIVNLSEKLLPYLNYVAETKPKIQGLPTGFPIFDSLIGGGLRGPGVHIVGARAGVGKSNLAMIISDNISTMNIPVLYMDTELTENITIARWCAKMTEIPVTQIETGQFAENLKTSDAMIKMAREIKKPFYYKNISGMHYQEWISLMRRFIMKVVGFNQDGNTNPCLIVVDYLKLMDLDHTGKFEEHQYLGQMITDLHNFCVQYNVSILALAQLNRDGISREDQGVIAGSDKLIGLCSSFTIMKDKTPEDLAADPLPNGNKKLVICKARFGPGNQQGEYINLITDLSISKMTEGQTNIQNRNGRNPLQLSVTKTVGKSKSKPVKDNDDSDQEDEHIDL